MTALSIESYVTGRWIAPDKSARPVLSALTGDVIGHAGNEAFSRSDALAYAREKGGPALRAMDFHTRAHLVKALAQYLHDNRQILYDLSFETGGTQKDHLIDVDGGIGTMRVFSSKARREMPEAHVFLDGPPEQLGRAGQFFGQHIYTPLLGAAVQINAFNFPVWGMLEKLAPALIAGVPSIVKPATTTCQVTEAAVRLMIQSDLLPDGALQLISGGLGDLLDHVDSQDSVAFTGSAATALKIRRTPRLLEEAVRFTAEQDSLNASVLGQDASPDTPEFASFIKEVSREITTKAGQKCTAIRRIMVPDHLADAVQDALVASLSKVSPGDPRSEGVRMGALVSRAQRDDVLDCAQAIGAEAELLVGAMEPSAPDGFDPEKSAFLDPMLFYCASPDTARAVHDREAFGPVSTLMPYRDTAHAVELLNRGKGSLVASVFSNDPDAVAELALGAAAFHGRIYINDRDAAAEATGHGTPLPHMTHGGPGRAGGGEELGGTRAIRHHMQRTALQGSPRMLTRLGTRWMPGATEHARETHPFRRTFGELQIGDTLHSASRKITLEDIETFAHFTGDTFYAHMDEEAAAANPFFPGRVAHGYLLLSFAAGLFVDPDPGPVLANTGLDNLRFMKPVEAGDTIRVRLTVKEKKTRAETHGEVRWHVTLFNQDDDIVAEYELLTMNAF